MNLSVRGIIAVGGVLMLVGASFISLAPANHIAQAGECFAPVQAQFHFDVVRNSPKGNMAAVVFTGDGGRHDNHAWINLDAIDKAVNPDVPGFAVRRRAGAIDIYFYGEHANHGEIAAGTIVLRNATWAGFSQDPKHPVEGQNKPGASNPIAWKIGEGGYNGQVTVTPGSSVSAFNTRVGADQDIWTQTYTRTPVPCPIPKPTPTHTPKTTVTPTPKPAPVIVVVTEQEEEQEQEQTNETGHNQQGQNQNETTQTAIIVGDNNTITQTNITDQRVINIIIEAAKKETVIRSADVAISKTDHRDLTRPLHKLTYDIKVTNTGESAVDDFKVVDRVPSQLEIISVSADGEQNSNTVTWSGISLAVGQSAVLRITAKVKADTVNGHLLTNRVKVTSADHGLAASSVDFTVVERQPQVASGVAPVLPVPVTARTGAGLAGAILSILAGSSLALATRAYWDSFLTPK